jgi:hypothetical protein
MDNDFGRMCKPLDTSPKNAGVAHVQEPDDWNSPVSSRPPDEEIMRIQFVQPTSSSECTLDNYSRPPKRKVILGLEDVW